jgi:hypothetical protein
MIKDEELADAVAEVEGEEGVTAEESRKRIRELIEANYTLAITPATPASEQKSFHESGPPAREPQD